MLSKSTATALVLTGIILGLALTRSDDGPASAAPPTGANSSREPEPAQGPLNDAETQLAAVLAEVSFENVPLGNAIEKLRDMSRANLVVLWRDLEQAGVTRDDPVRARLHNVRVSTALRVILDSLYHADGPARLDYAAEGELILISTENLVRPRGLTTRVYDITDFIERLFNPLPHPLPNPPAHGDAGRTPATGDTVCTAGGGGDGPRVDYLSRQEPIDALIQMIEQNIDPNSWRDAGGTIGWIREMGGLLIVEQRPANHLRIARLLYTLRTMQAAREAGVVPWSQGADIFKGMDAKTGMPNDR